MKQRINSFGRRNGMKANHNHSRIDDNVGQRMGIGIAVSVGLNALILIALPKPPNVWAQEPHPHPPSGPVHIVKQPGKATPLMEKEPEEKQETQKEEIVREQNIREQEEIQQKEITQTILSKKRDHGPHVTPPQVVIVRRTPTPASSEPAPASTPIPSSPAEPVEMRLKQSGSAMTAGDPSQIAGAARETAPSAGHISSSAVAAVGGPTALSSAAGHSLAAGPARHAELRTPGGASPRPAFVPVAALETRTSTTGFVIPTVDSTGTRHSVAVNAIAARTNAATGVSSALHTLSTAGGSGESPTMPDRTLSLRSTGLGGGIKNNPLIGSGIAKVRQGNASVEVPTASGIGSATAGRISRSSAGRNATGAIGSGPGAQTDSSQGTTGGVDNEGNPRGLSGTHGTSLQGSFSDGGGAAHRTIGGTGEVNTRGGASDGVVTIGKIGGDPEPTPSNGFKGKGPVAIGPGKGGETPTIGGPRGGFHDVEELPESEPLDEETQGVITQKGPRPVDKPAFEIPDSLHKRKIKGMVQIRAEVKKDGSSIVTVLKGSGDAELDSVVLNYVKSWKWSPARQNGEAMDSARLIRFRVN